MLLTNKRSIELKEKMQNSFEKRIETINCALKLNSNNETDSLRMLEIKKYEKMDEEERKKALGALILFIAHGRHSRGEDKFKFLSYLNVLLSNMPEDNAYEESIVSDFLNRVERNSSMSRNTFAKECYLFRKLLKGEFEKQNQSKKYRMIVLLNKFLDYGSDLVTLNPDLNIYFSYLNTLKKITDSMHSN